VGFIVSADLSRAFNHVLSAAVAVTGAAAGGVVCAMATVPDIASSARDAAKWKELNFLRMGFLLQIVAR
jgi:hypothetical protein